MLTFMNYERNSQPQFKDTMGSNLAALDEFDDEPG